MHREMFDQFHTARRTNSDHQLVRKDMDVDEHERLSKTQIKMKVTVLLWM
jgi:hypothetical protein